MGIPTLSISSSAYFAHVTSSLFDVNMKVLLLALFVGVALAGDCDEPRPEYCAKNVHLCKVPGFIDFMKKMCPRHCGYCNTEEAVEIDCVEPRPEYCAKNVHLCKVPGFIDFMKKMCPIHCDTVKQ